MSVTTIHTNHYIMFALLLISFASVKIDVFLGHKKVFLSL